MMSPRTFLGRVAAVPFIALLMWFLPAAPLSEEDQFTLERLTPANRRFLVEEVRYLESIEVSASAAELRAAKEFRRHNPLAVTRPIVRAVLAELEERDAEREEISDEERQAEEEDRALEVFQGRRDRRDIDRHGRKGEKILVRDLPVEDPTSVGEIVKRGKLVRWEREVPDHPGVIFTIEAKPDREKLFDVVFRMQSKEAKHWKETHAFHCQVEDRDTPLDPHQTAKRAANKQNVAVTVVLDAPMAAALLTMKGEYRLGFGDVLFPMHPVDGRELAGYLEGKFFPLDTEEAIGVFESVVDEEHKRKKK